MKWNELSTETCSIARTLSVIGDRWVMLIIRDVFLGKQNFSEIEKSIGIAKPRLSERLNQLLQQDVLEKRIESGSKRAKYKLTKKGQSLYPIIMSMVEWGDEWLTDEHGVPMEYIHKTCNKVTRAGALCDHCKKPIEAKEMLPKLGPAIINTLRNRANKGEALKDIKLTMAIPKSMSLKELDDLIA
ncbi:MAG: transcriptional regulator [Moraxellaceae bacterium]|nr:MAG: transcriptional regulator [Moraxellaceae bacterium]